MATKQPVPASGPILPSRYEEVLNQRVTAQAERLLATAQAARPAFEVPRWGMPVAVLGLGAMAAMALLGSQERPASSRVNFDKSSVISTGSVGVQASAAELMPVAQPSPEPATPAAELASLMPSPAPHTHAPSPAPPSPRPPRAAATKPRSAAGKCTNCDARKVADGGVGPVAASSPAPELAVAPSPSPEPPKPALNVGSRFPAVLAFPVKTAFSGSPVAVRVESDIAPNGPVAIPAGSTLIGEAFATDSDDRAQIVFTAIIREGRTVPFRGLAMGVDNELGIPGKVIRKASAAKKGAGRVLGAIGSAVTYGLIGGNNGVVGDAAAAMAGKTAMDLAELERDWSQQRSDKVLEVKAGVRLTVYVQTDVAAP